MLHYLYHGWTDPGESVKHYDCVELKAYRCKMSDGSYKIVLADHKPKMGGNPGHLVSEAEPWTPEPDPQEFVEEENPGGDGLEGTDPE